MNKQIKHVQFESSEGVPKKYPFKENIISLFKYRPEFFVKILRYCEHGKQIMYDTAISVSLWCVIKLLNVTKGLDKFSGSNKEEEGQNKEKPVQKKTEETATTSKRGKSRSQRGKATKKHLENDKPSSISSPNKGVIEKNTNSPKDNVSKSTTSINFEEDHYDLPSTVQLKSNKRQKKKKVSDDSFVKIEKEDVEVLDQLQSKLSKTERKVNTEQPPAKSKAGKNANSTETERGLVKNKSTNSEKVKSNTEKETVSKTDVKSPKALTTKSKHPEKQVKVEGLAKSENQLNIVKQEAETKLNIKKNISSEANLRNNLGNETVALKASTSFQKKKNKNKKFDEVSSNIKKPEELLPSKVPYAAVVNDITKVSPIILHYQKNPKDKQTVTKDLEETIRKPLETETSIENNLNKETSPVKQFTKEDLNVKLQKINDSISKLDEIFSKPLTSFDIGDLISTGESGDIKDNIVKSGADAQSSESATTFSEENPDKLTELLDISSTIYETLIITEALSKLDSHLSSVESEEETLEYLSEVKPKNLDLEFITSDAAVLQDYTSAEKPVGTINEVSKFDNANKGNSSVLDAVNAIQDTIEFLKNINSATEVESVEKTDSEAKELPEDLHCVKEDTLELVTEVAETVVDGINLEEKELPEDLSSVHSSKETLEPAVCNLGTGTLLQASEFVNERKDNNLALDITVEESSDNIILETEETAAVEVINIDSNELLHDLLAIEENSSTPDVKDITSNFILEESAKQLFAEFDNTVKGPTSDNISETLDTMSPATTKQLIPDSEMDTRQVRILTLTDNEHQDSTIYRIEKHWILQFRLGPSLLGRKISLFCNYPKGNTQFKRDEYYELEWLQDEGCKHSDDTASFAQIVAQVAGSFHFYFTYNNLDVTKVGGSGFFLVDPVLKFDAANILPLDCIQCQTVLSKSLGPLSTWKSKLRVAKETGYNMIHFTPIQELGASNSSYSLSGQLKINPIFHNKDKKVTFDDVENLIRTIRTEWKMLSICDIVLNHTANESEWLNQHPEATYNCLNCPHLRPAYLLDAALYQFSIDVGNGLYEDRGIPIEVNTEGHLGSIRYSIQKYVLPTINIGELYSCDVNSLVSEFLNLARTTLPEKNVNVKEELVLIQDEQFRRLNAKVDLKLALKTYNIFRPDCYDEESRLKRCAAAFKTNLDALNEAVLQEITDHLNAAIDNCIGGIRYFRVQYDGPRIEKVTKKHPLVPRYFTDYGTPQTIKEYENLMYSENSKFLMAHNGWVMNADPLRNFAASDSFVYLRRELIAWGDSVKLRYGDKPEDSPFLWSHMKKYMEQTAKIFDGVRLDNCHSTPIPVAEYLLDCARKERPDLYVVAELFTNSDHKDNIFVNRLGITSLIREAMSAWDSHEQGRLVYRYGGVPVGSFHQPRMRPLVPSVAHALFLDLTHDNPSPIQKRSVFDLLPSSALVSMACCASGSNRGYDELVPHHIHVVDESRQYTEWADPEVPANQSPRFVNIRSGIVPAKRALNNLHFQLGKEGFDEVYVDQMDPDIVAVTRHNPKTHESYVLVAFTAFSHPPLDAANYQRGIKPLRVEGVLDEIVLEATLNHVNLRCGGSKYEKIKNHKQDVEWLNGLSEYQTVIKEHIGIDESSVFEKADSGNPNILQLNFKNFKAGSVVVVKVSLRSDVQKSIGKLRDLTRSFSKSENSELKKIINRLNLSDLNKALYRCDQEERDDGFGFDVYNIPNFGPLVYSGLQGFMSLLSKIRPSNDLGHPMCGNLRDGNWMIDYIWHRLKVDEGTKELSSWIEEKAKYLKDIPRYLIPCYFDILITGIYLLLLEQVYDLKINFVKHGSVFVKGLALGSVQFGAVIKSAGLPVLSPNLKAPRPPQKTNDKEESEQACVTLSAGLPHFSVGYMRNWGRDTFIALRGLFILTGRYQDARYHILGYAACLRHGLIPNLLDGGRNPRYNCRDAVWWWLYCIKSYVEEVPNGIEILSDNVSRIFPTDDSPNQVPGAVEQKLQDVIQEALKVHFQGLAFRERNAGRQIDAHMADKGFNNQIGIHPETGFVFGGNDMNCGTWMDKMGSSDKAGNRGKPATPRDGSAIELIGLSKSVISWLDKLYQQKQYPYGSVQRTNKSGTIISWTFKQWADRIQINFEKYFWVNEQPTTGELRPDLINKRGIYKDCYGASQEWSDFQLRCNFPITMVVAPELFTPKHAWVALEKVEKHLVGPLGIKTLDPDDWAYQGDYDNSNDSGDASVAHGFNYHQGPEWVWPMGFYLRAKLHFAAENGQLKETVANTKTILSKHFVELQTSPWRGLPELTNSNGSYCRDSSRTQAWSMSCILEVLHDLQKIESTNCD